MSGEYAIVDPADVPAEPFPESGNSHRKLTDALGCTEMRINSVTLPAGTETAPHAHERQEEVYIALDGGTVCIDDVDHEVPPGGLVRIGPTPARSVRNRSTTEQTWLMIGAPPVGSIDNFGEYRMPDDPDERDPVQ